MGGTADSAPRREVASFEPGPVRAAPVADAVPRGLCTQFGISRSGEPKRCGQACQFIARDCPRLEAQVHGRARNPARPDELHFGPFQRLLRAALTTPSEGAQRTGITTRSGERGSRSSASRAGSMRCARWAPGATPTPPTPRIGPRGLEFARTRVEMKALETVVHLRREPPHRV